MVKNREMKPRLNKRNFPKFPQSPAHVAAQFAIWVCILLLLAIVAR